MRHRFAIRAALGLLTASVVVVEASAQVGIGPIGPRSSPTEVAREAARRAGAGGDLDALQAIGEQREPTLLFDYLSRYPRRRTLSTDFERVLAPLVRDPLMGKPAVAFLATWPDCSWTYASRELFDALLSALDGAGDAAASRLVTRRILCTTQSGVGRALAERLSNAAPENAQPILEFLARRRAADAIPVLRDTLRAAAFERTFNLPAQMDTELIAIDTPEAFDALYERIAYIASRASHVDAEPEARLVARALRERSSSTPLRYPGVRPLLVAPLGWSVRKDMIDVARSLRDHAAVDDLLSLLGTTNDFDAAKAVLEIGTPDDWARLGQAVECAGHDWDTGERKALHARIESAAGKPGTF